MTSPKPDGRKSNGSAVSRNAWTATEDMIVTRYYADPKISWKQLQEMLPRRSVDAISMRATGTLGIHRRRTTKHSNLRIIRRLWDLREREGLTRAQLAKRMGYHEVLLARWECGTAAPSLQRLVDWCLALGAELTAEYKGSPVQPTSKEDDEDLLMLPPPMEAQGDRA